MKRLIRSVVSAAARTNSNAAPDRFQMRLEGRDRLGPLRLEVQDQVVAELRHGQSLFGRADVPSAGNFLDPILELPLGLCFAVPCRLAHSTARSPVFDPPPIASLVNAARAPLALLARCVHRPPPFFCRLRYARIHRRWYARRLALASNRLLRSRPLRLALYRRSRAVMT